MPMIIAETIEHDEKAKHLTMIMEAEFDQCKVEEVVNDHGDTFNHQKSTNLSRNMAANFDQ